MTIDEAILKEHNYMQCTNHSGCYEYHEQLAEWLEELNEYRKIGTVEECKNSVMKILEAYNKAIDDLLKEVQKRPMLNFFQNNELIDIAEQLKEGEQLKVQER